MKGRLMKKKKDLFGKEVIELDIADVLVPKQLVRADAAAGDNLRDLMISIKNNGLIEPIIVKKAGKKYKIIAGHRRFLAHQLGEMDTIRAIVADVTPKAALMMRWEENESREDVGDFDRMRFLAEMLDHTELTQKELAVRIGKSEAYVSQRLMVWNGDQEILDLVRNKRMTFSVARELNLAPTKAIAKEFIPYCKDEAASAKQVKEWIKESANRMSTETAVEDPVEEVAAVRQWVDEFACDMCAQKTQKVEMVIFRLCRSCAQAIVDARQNMSSE